MCPTFTVYLFQNQLCFVLGGSPALLFLLPFSVSAEAKGTLFSNKEEKVKQQKVPQEPEAEKAGCLGAGGDGMPPGLGMLGSCMLG